LVHNPKISEPVGGKHACALFADLLDDDPPEENFANFAAYN
jgi:hypothetical protein